MKYTSINIKLSIKYWSTLVHESDNGSDRIQYGTHRNLTKSGILQDLIGIRVVESDEIFRVGFDWISSGSPKKSDEIQQKNLILRIVLDFSTRIPIGPDIGFMDLGISTNTHKSIHQLHHQLIRPSTAIHKIPDYQPELFQPNSLEEIESSDIDDETTSIDVNSN